MALRDTNIGRLTQGTFDVLVLGGGINGAVSAAAPARAGCRLGKATKAQITWTSTKRPESPEVIRWVNSMMVAALFERGKTSPLQVGQWLPQPAPDPLART